jgi:hypothetical protein
MTRAGMKSMTRMEVPNMTRLAQNLLMCRGMLR